MFISTWQDALQIVIQESWQVFVSFLPNLLGAIIIFAAGWLIAGICGAIITRILEKIKFNQFLEKTGWDDSLEKAGLKLDGSGFIGVIVKWLVVVVFLMAATDILGWREFTTLLRSIIDYIPNIVIAVLIFIIAIIIADILEKIVKASIKKMGLKYVNFIAGLTRWAIWIFAGLAILSQLKVTPVIINSIVIGLVATFTISMGLAFGLGGKNIAAKLIEDFYKKISEKER